MSRRIHRRLKRPLPGPRRRFPDGQRDPLERAGASCARTDAAARDELAAIVVAAGQDLEEADAPRREAIDFCEYYARFRGTVSPKRPADCRRAERGMVRAARRGRRDQTEFLATPPA